MASEIELDVNYELKDLQHSLRAAGLELSLERSKHSVEIVAKDESIRKLRLSECLLQDQVDELHEQLDEEEARSEDLEEALNEALLSLEQQKADSLSAQQQIQKQTREVANLKAELKNMENVNTDSNKILSEKLALTREMSSLKPEVEHLRAQVEANKGLLAEKLSLQRELTTLQVELENEKRSTARIMAKHGKKSEQDDELRIEIDGLRQELAKEKKDRLKAETAVVKAEQALEKVKAELESQQQAAERVQSKLDKLSKKGTEKANKRDEERDAELEALREQLEDEKRERKKAEKANKKSGERDDERDAEVEELRQALEHEKRERQKADKASKSDKVNNVQVDEVRKELEEEKCERKKMEKEYQKSLGELQGRNTVLDDKLNAFREKLRATKDKLKEKESELESLKNAANIKQSVEICSKPVKNPRKRIATSIEPDTTTLGTPGDGFPAKRSKRAASVAIGEVSNFSLTPFLNRKGSVAAASPIAEESIEEEAEATPTVMSKKGSKNAVPSKSKPLAPSASSKANAKPAPRKKTALSSLEMVTEEASEPSETAENIPVKVPLKDADDGAPTKKSLKPKPRKSLLSFANFTDEPVAEKKKKRKIGAAGGGGGFGKTLFDDDEESVPSKPVSGKGIFAARALGKSMLGKASNRPITGGFNMLSEENFTFSPLKRDRKNASILG